MHFNTMMMYVLIVTLKMRKHNNQSLPIQMTLPLCSPLTSTRLLQRSQTQLQQQQQFKSGPSWHCYLVEPCAGAATTDE